MTLWTQDMDDKLRSLRQAGQSYGLCANEIGGVSRSAVIGRARRIGILGQVVRPSQTRRRPGRLNPAAIVAMARAGVPYADIAAAFATSPDVIKAKLVKLRKSGVDVPRRNGGGDTTASAGRRSKPSRVAEREAEFRAAGGGNGVHVELAAIVLPGVEPIRFADRRSECVWPISGKPGPDMLVCGAPLDDAAIEMERCYCPTHRAIAFIPPDPSKRRTAQRQWWEVRA